MGFLDENQKDKKPFPMTPDKDVAKPTRLTERRDKGYNEKPRPKPKPNTNPKERII